MSLPENPGLAISGGAHIGLLALALISFAGEPQLTEGQESIPVSIVTSEQFSQITKGEKTAAEVKSRPRAEKIAQSEERTAKPSPADAGRDILAPPSALKRQKEPGEAEPEPEPKPAPRAVQAKEAPKPEPAAGAARPPPAPRPDENAAEAAAPAPPKPAAEAKKPQPKFRPDSVARLLDEVKRKEKPKAAAKPKSGEEAAEPQHKFDLGDIANYLNKEKPQRKQARAQELSQQASLGAPLATGAKMSPSLWDQLDGLLQEQYKRCWNFSGLGGQQKYIPEIHVHYSPDGGLIGPPELLNPPSDPNLQALAESAMRAVRRCDPLRIPAQYQPYYEQWKGRIVRFDPEEMS
ncbi:MAG: cell envelope biogenesis protein TolA [Methylocapsa sp.]|nr:cell envelope biogenesis protein TolA [Methylocapsa sp.]